MPDKMPVLKEPARRRRGGKKLLVILFMLFIVILCVLFFQFLHQQDFDSYYRGRAEIHEGSGHSESAGITVGMLSSVRRQRRSKPESGTLKAIETAK